MLRTPARARKSTGFALAITLIASGLAGTTAASAEPITPVDAPTTAVSTHVDPFIGTLGDHGNDLPGAQAPHGLAKVNPLTQPGRNHSGYDYGQSRIAGFTNTNLDGVGGSGGGGDILVVPTSVEYTQRPNRDSYAKPFSHDNETASPGYYQVGLGAITGTNTATPASGTINAEVTADTRTGMHRYTFPEGQQPSLVVDLGYNFTERISSDVTVTTLDDGRVALSGAFEGRFNGARYALNYYAETDQPVTAVQTWSASGELSDATHATGPDSGVILTFDEQPGGTEIGFRVTLSPISADQAAIDQQVEVGGKTFDQVRSDVAAEWETRLASVLVEASELSDPDGELQTLFYTHLYRVFALPMNATSTSGTYKGVDGVVHQANGTYYDGWASWDDFRKYSVIAYLDPGVYRDIIQSLIVRFADQSATGQTNPFNLTHSVPNVRWERSAVIVADALSKGYTDFDRLDEAYPALKALSGYYNGDQLRNGWINDRPGDGVQRGYDHWGMSIIADELGYTADAADYRAQALLPINNQYKPGAWTAPDGTPVGVLTPRGGNGDWATVDYERFDAANLYQGTLWQYNWYGAYDMAGLAEAMGGEHATLEALKHMFGENAPNDGSRMLHSNANEIDLQAPYLFNYVGAPHLTQKWVRAIYTSETWNRYIATGRTDGNNPPSANGEFTPPWFTKVYKASPDGLLPTMDNDAGTMSTMFVAAALGMFPVTMGSSQYQIGSPFFESATISYDTGRTFTVQADGVSPAAFYVQDATLRGAAFNNTWIDFADIIGGGTLAFTMGTTPSTWGEQGEPAYSLSGEPVVPADRIAVTASPTAASAAEDGTIDAEFTLTIADGASLAAAAGTELIAESLASVSGLPSGATATVTVVDALTLAVHVTGTVAKQSRIWVNLSDAALVGTTAAQLAGQGISQTAPLTLSTASTVRVELQTLVDAASLVRKANYSTTSFNALTTALSNARAQLANPAASAAKLQTAYDRMQSAVNQLVLSEGGYRVLEGEQSDAWSGGELKNESNSSNGNLGGVRNGAWVRYYDLDFAGEPPTKLHVRYALSRAATTPASGLKVRAGDENGPVVGTLTLPGTGSWSNWVTVTADITDPEALAAADMVTFTFEAPAGEQWVSNFDWFQFVDQEETGIVSTTVEAEDWVTNSGGALKKETGNWTSGTVTNIGATADGDWIDYGTINFGSRALTEVEVHYVHNSARCGDNSRIEFYLDAADPANPGTPFVTVPLPTTANNWNGDGRAVVALPEGLSGSHRLTAVLRTDEWANHPFVANINNYTFRTADTAGPVDRTALEQAIAAAEVFEDQLDRYVPIDAAVFQRTLDAARALYADESATQEQVRAQARALRLATSQLAPDALRTLEYELSLARQITNQRYTEESWSALQDAITAGQAAIDDENADDAVWSARATALREAREALAVRGLSVPGVPLDVTATTEASAITVRWSAPFDDGGTPITAYIVSLDEGQQIRVGADETSATFTWLRPGSAYRASVVAKNEIGESVASDLTDPVMPHGATAPAAGAAPLGLTALGQPYDPGVLDATYPSDQWPGGGDTYVIEMLSAFDTLPATAVGANDDVIRSYDAMVAYNDKKVVEINNNAPLSQIERARSDADAHGGEEVAEGFGSNLGQVYRDALAAGDLPKTQAILERVHQRLPGADAVKPVWQYNRPYLRLGLHGQGGLIRENYPNYSGLAGQGAFPSGHTFWATIRGTALATLVPEMGVQVLTRATESGDNRLVLGFHYPLDVIGSRMLAQSVIAHRWADPQFAPLLQEARAELVEVLTEDCIERGFGATLVECQGTPYIADEATALATYEYRLTYDFPHTSAAGQPMIVPEEAAALLITSFPELTTDQRKQIIEQTATDSGRALDLTNLGKPSWQRVNLAAAMAAEYTLDGAGRVTVTNFENQTAASVSTLARIEVADVAIDGFDPNTRSHVVDWPAALERPTITGVAGASGAVVYVDETETGATIEVISVNGEYTDTYQVVLNRTGDDHRPNALKPIDVSTLGVARTIDVGDAMQGLGVILKRDGTPVRGESVAFMIDGPATFIDGTTQASSSSNAGGIAIAPRIVATGPGQVVVSAVVGGATYPLAPVTVVAPPVAEAEFTVTPVLDGTRWTLVVSGTGPWSDGATIRISTRYGTKTLTGVAAGATVENSFKTFVAKLPASSVTVRITDGDEVTVLELPYPAQ